MKVFLILVISLVSFNVQANGSQPDGLDWECSTAFGEETYILGCANCHDVLPQQIVPKFQSGDRLEKTDAELIESILNGLNMMPPWKSQGWTDEELKEIICYIRSLENKE